MRDGHAVVGLVRSESGPASHRLEDSGGLGHEAGRQHSANVDDLLVGKPLVQPMVSSFRVAIDAH